jgi:hypothetical protein
MAKLYLLSYPPGASGDFLAGRIVSSSTSFYDEYHIDEYEYILSTGDNCYPYQNPLSKLGISCKTHHANVPVATVDYIPGIEKYKPLKNISQDVLDDFWNSRVETQFGKLNVMASTHVTSVHAYPWPNRVSGTLINVDQKDAEFIAFLYFIKNFSNSGYALSKWHVISESDLRYAESDSYLHKYFKVGDKISYSLFGTLNNSKEIIKQCTDPLLLENAISVLENTDDPIQRAVVGIRLMLDHWRIRIVNWKYELDKDSFQCIIELDKLYAHDSNELHRLFESFGSTLDAKHEERIWKYFDTNTKMFADAGGKEGWMEYCEKKFLEKIMKDE